MRTAIPVTVAWSFWQRVRGLLGRPQPPAGTGFLIPCCHAVHTYGMRYPIDVVFLDRDYRILSIRQGVAPCRYARQRHATAVLEMAAGEASASGIFVDQCLDMLMMSAT